MHQVLPPEKLTQTIFFMAEAVCCCLQTFNNVHQSHSQNDSGDLRGVAGGDGELECLCGKAGASHLCDGSAHSSGCVVNGSNAMAAFIITNCL